MLFIVISFRRNLRTLFLEESSIVEKDDQWLHELALNNTVLETLNFYMTDLIKVKFEDLELIAKNCSSLTSVKTSDCEILELVDFFRAAAGLEEFCGGFFNEQSEKYSVVSLPQKLCRLGLSYMGKNEMPIVFPFANLLKKLDLLYALLDTEDHCTLIQRCPNLEVLEVGLHSHFVLLFNSLLFYVHVSVCVWFLFFCRVQELQLYDVQYIHVKINTSSGVSLILFLWSGTRV